MVTSHTGLSIDFYWTLGIHIDWFIPGSAASYPIFPLFGNKYCFKYTITGNEREWLVWVLKGVGEVYRHAHAVTQTETVPYARSDGGWVRDTLITFIMHEKWISLCYVHKPGVYVRNRGWDSVFIDQYCQLQMISFFWLSVFVDCREYSPQQLLFCV